MNKVHQIQILDKTVSISLSAYTLRKGMNPTILSLSMGKLKGRLAL